VILLDPLARPVVAHRGASGDWPENTLLAFSRAVEAGADALECDVRISADGVPVIIHDPTLDRTTGGRGPVHRLPLAALRTLDAGRGERIPTLDDLLDGFPDTPVILEIKDARAAGPVRRVLEAHQAQGRVLVASFDPRALRPFGHGFARAASRPEVGMFLAAARMGLPPFRTRFRAFTVPETSGRITIVEPRFAGRARRLGLPVHVWTVDDPARGARLREMGVAGIITNFPGRFRSTASRP
jgi:glycerophosphoryl diester phosphodiesterase